MSSVPDWLTEESIQRTEALGREMMAFLARRRKAAGEAGTAIQPRREFLELLEALRSKEQDRTAAGEGASDG